MKGSARRLLTTCLLALGIVLVVWLVCREGTPTLTPAQRLVDARATCQREAHLFPLPDSVKAGTAQGLRQLGQYTVCMYARGYTAVPPVH